MKRHGFEVKRHGFEVKIDEKVCFEEKRHDFEEKRDGRLRQPSSSEEERRIVLICSV